jgi:hypothetical protein
VNSCDFVPEQIKKVVKKMEPMDDYPGAVKFYDDDMDWQETLAENLEPRLKEDNKKFVENVRRFGGSSVRNFELEEMAMNQAFTNWQGLRGPPKFVPVRLSSREQPSYNTDVLKTVRRHLM